MMKKLICCLLALALCAGCALAEGAVLTVQGAGSVSLAADTATISLGIHKYEADVKAAQQAVNRNMDAVIRALTEAGVDEADIYTNSISIYPEYDYESRYEGDDENANIKGYSASNSITIETGDIERVGDYIDAAFEAGANTLDDVRFSAADTRAASDEALRLAVESAWEKAGVLAEAAGMQLGGILSITEGDSYSTGGPVLMARNSAAVEEASDKTRVLASQQQVSAAVTVQFALEEK